MRTSFSDITANIIETRTKTNEDHCLIHFHTVILCSYNLDCHWLQTMYFQLLEIGSILRISNTFISRLNHINYTQPILSKTEGENLIATICCALTLKLVIFVVLHSLPTFGRAQCWIDNAALIAKHFACIETNDAFFIHPIHFKNTVIIWKNNGRHTNDLERTVLSIVNDSMSF